MLAILLSLTASAFLGVADFIAAVKTRSIPVLLVLAVSQGFGLLILVPACLLQFQPPSPPEAVYAILAGCVGTIGLAALYHGMAVGRISVVAPIAATAPIVPVGVGIASGDRLSSYQVAGIGLIVVGSILVARVRTLRGTQKATLRQSDALFGLAAALGGGCFLTSLDAASVQGQFLWPVAIARATLFGIVAGASVAAGYGRFATGDSKDAFSDRGLIVVGLLDVSSWVAFAWASTLGMLSVVSVLASLYPAVTITLARTVLGERVSRLQGIGLGSVLTGLVLVLLMGQG